MSRGDGFAIADVDVGLLDDPKVRQLVRSTRDEGLAARCLVAYLSVVTASWGEGDRVAIEDAAPLWITALDDVRERLAAVGLLDAEGCIPAKAWEGWYGPARDRREERRQAGRRGGLAKAANRASGATAEPEHSQSEALPVPIRTDPSRADPSLVRTEGLPHVNGAVGAAWEAASGRTVLASGRFAAEYLDDASRRHPETAITEAIKQARTGFDHVPESAVLAAAVRGILDPFPAKEKAATDDATAAEQERRRRARERTIRDIHDRGGHTDGPDPRCPSCEAGAA